MKRQLPLIAALLCAAACKIDAGPTTPKPTLAVEPKEETEPKKEGDNPSPLWEGDIDWQTWEAGLAKAKADKRPLCLVVYANWCPRCKELAPAVMGDSELTELARKMVMVLQDNDERPPWLAQKFAQYGGYVPRVFFLDPSGAVREDLNSRHPRYPYFYAGQGRGLEILKENMRKALGSAG